MRKKQHSVANKYSTPEQKKALKRKKTPVSKNVQRLAKKKLPKITKNPCEKKQHFKKKCKNKKTCGKTKEEPLQKKNLQNKTKPYCKTRKKNLARNKTRPFEKKNLR